eukprot:Gb_08551 [translate_table: standard]
MKKVAFGGRDVPRRDTMELGFFSIFLSDWNKVPPTVTPRNTLNTIK